MIREGTRRTTPGDSFCPTLLGPPRGEGIFGRNAQRGRPWGPSSPAVGSSSLRTPPALVRAVGSCGRGWVRGFSQRPQTQRVLGPGRLSPALPWMLRSRVMGLAVRVVYW